MTDDEVENIFTSKDIALFSDDIEIYVDETLRAENVETVYTDQLVQVFFADHGLTDPSLFNEQSLEGSLLGSCSNYRGKIMVSNSDDIILCSFIITKIEIN